MPLTDDQKALLRLLAQREHGYEDIGALMGLSVDEVRARVREALAELDRMEGESGERAPLPPPPPPPPPPRMREAAPQTPPPPAPPFRPAAPSLPRARLTKDRRRLYELIGGVVVVALIVLFATGTVNIGGGSGSSTSSKGATPASGSGTTVGSKRLTQAVLRPVGGGNASGQALFGRLGKEVVLQVVARGLEPSPPGQSYTVWLYRSPKLVLRVGAAKVAKEGRLGVRFPLPAELLAYVAAGAFKQIHVSLTSDAAYRREVAQAKKEKSLPPFTGTDVLSGEITGPIVKK